MKRVAVGIICLIGFTVYAIPQHQCDLRAMHKQLVQDYLIPEQDAHAYTLAFENFLVNLDLLQIRLRESVYKGEFYQIKPDLIHGFGISEEDAEYLIATMRLVRLVSMKYGLATGDDRCTGVR